MYRQGALEDYVADAAAKKPAPGGGSVSGLVGALAAAMGEMSANFTAGKKKFAAVDATVRQMLEILASRRDALLQLMERDVEAYSGVDAAYAMARDTDEQKAARREAIDRALRAAMEAPLDIMRECVAVAGVSDELADIGNPNLITDVGVSAILTEAACAAARLNVEVNLKYIKDGELNAATTAEMEELTRRVQQCRESVTWKVGVHLRG